ncbi:MAG TPA: hypothetical protein VI564_07940 [Candidatus Nanoarchaeia archaeon]|nr:hypothetical protein [Candidatus Nanoarchaeia archaeon]
MTEKKFKPYNIKRIFTYAAAVGLIYGMALIGDPPPKVTKVVEKPLNLKKADGTAYRPDDFAHIDIYIPGESKPLCSIDSTTAVRSYFAPDHHYSERTRLDSQICRLPDGVSDLELKVVSPYEPEKDSINHNLDGCTDFQKGPGGWTSDCKAKLDKDGKSITFLIYEKVPYDNNDGITPQDHQRKADLIQVKVKK